MIRVGNIEYTPIDKVITIYSSSGEAKAEVAMNINHVHHKQLMTHNYVEVIYNLAQPASLVRGDYIRYAGNCYVLRTDALSDSSPGYHRYELKFEAVEMLAQDVKMYFLKQGLREISWSLHGNAKQFAQIAVDNLNRYLASSLDIYLGAGRKFVVGTVDDSEYKTINFNEQSVWDALRSICETFDMEFIFEAGTLHIRKKCDSESEVILYKGLSVTDIVRTSGGENEGFNRIVALGSTRNLPPDYRGTATTPNGDAVEAIVPKRLRIPASYGDELSLHPHLLPHQVVEGTVIFEDIYPKRVTTITDVGTKSYTQATDEGEAQRWNAYRFKDEGLTFSKRYIIQNEELRIRFETGHLAGMEFGLMFNPDEYPESDSRAQVFEIVRNDTYGMMLPNDTIKPIEGDKCVIYNFDVGLVHTKYVEDAEQELVEKALEWLNRQHVDDSVYSLRSIIEIFYANSWNFEIGQRIHLHSDTVLAGETHSRIVGFEKAILNPYDATYSIGAKPALGSLRTLKKEVEKTQDETQKVIVKQEQYNREARRHWQDAQQTALLLERAMKNYGKSINPLAVRTMAMMVGDESLQFRFVESKTSERELPPLVVFNKDTKAFTVRNRQNEGASLIIRHYTMGITDIRNDRPLTQYKHWVLPALPSVTLSQASTPYYLYARVQKATEQGEFVLSPTEMEFEQADHYALLVGILNSELDNDRSFAPTYGYTEVLPGRITTDKVVSSDGNSYFDLTTGDIVGKFKFRLPEGEKSITDIIDGITLSSRNLIRNTAYRSRLDGTHRHPFEGEHAGVIGNTSITVMKDENGVLFARVHQLESTNPFAGIWLNRRTLTQKINIGDEVCLSFEVRGNATWNHLLMEGTGMPRVPQGQEGTLTDVWRKIVLTDRVGTNNDDNRIYWLVNSGNSYFDIRNIKLTKANKADEWTEAPEDINAEVDNLEYLRKALQGSTDIQGGLVLSSLIGARDTQGEVRSYLSGLSGQRVRDYALATGVTAFGTQGEQAKSWLDFNGNAKFGDLRIGRAGDGKVWVEDNAGNERIVFTPDNVPDLASKLRETGQDVTLTLPQKKFVSGNASNTLFQDVQVLHSGTELTLVGKLQLRWQHTTSSESYNRDVFPYGGTAVTLIVRRMGTRGAEDTDIATWTLHGTGRYHEVVTSEQDINVRIPNLQAGTHHLVLSIRSWEGHGQATVPSGATARVLYELDKQAMVLGRDGLSLFWGLSRYFHLKNGELAFKGNTNLPGVLASGTVELSMNKRNTWGAKANNISAAVDNNGIYTIPHNVGHSEYSINVIAHTDRLTPVIVSRGNTSFRVKFHNPSGAATQTAFDYQLFGRN